LPQPDLRNLEDGLFFVYLEIWLVRGLKTKMSQNKRYEDL
jgi:hypothetical protein